jgi:hypothetical protein
VTRGGTLGDSDASAVHGRVLRMSNSTLVALQWAIGCMYGLGWLNGLLSGPAAQASTPVC